MTREEKLKTLNAALSKRNGLLECEMLMANREIRFQRERIWALEAALEAITNDAEGLRQKARAALNGRTL